MAYLHSFFRGEFSEVRRSNLGSFRTGVCSFFSKRDFRMPYENMEWKGQLSVFPWELQTQAKEDINLLVKLVLDSFTIKNLSEC